MAGYRFPKRRIPKIKKIKRVQGSVLLFKLLVTTLRASRRTPVGLAGCAPRLVPNHGHLALIPDASGPALA